MTEEQAEHAPLPAFTGADDPSLAAALAGGAGRELVALRERAGRGDVPLDGPGLGACGDATAQAWLAAALAEARPADAILSEEGVRDDRRLAAERVWIVDPLDGTREFAERDGDGTRRADFAVHVALWTRTGGLVAGAVALPARRLVLASHTVARVAPDRARAVLQGGRPLRIAVSRTRPPAFIAGLVSRADVELVPLGSTGVKVAAVIDGTADAYVHAGGQYEWDSAAPVAVARAAGLVATRLDGSAVGYNRPDPWSPDLLVCDPAVEDRLRALIGVDAEAAR